jgi:exonuclease III
MDYLIKTIEAQNLDLLLLQDVHSTKSEINVVKKRYKDYKIIFSESKYKKVNNIKSITKALQDKYEIIGEFSKISLLNPYNKESQVGTAIIIRNKLLIKSFLPIKQKSLMGRTTQGLFTLGNNNLLSVWSVYAPPTRQANN